jgi:hypothetical protein
MPAYLQRLLDTAAPTPGAALGLAPVVRSSSPVFEENQLIALDAQAGASPDAPSFEPSGEGWQMPTPDRAPPASAFPQARSGSPSPVPTSNAPLTPAPQVPSQPAAPLLRAVPLTELPFATRIEPITTPDAIVERPELSRDVSRPSDKPHATLGQPRPSPADLMEVAPIGPPPNVARSKVPIARTDQAGPNAEARPRAVRRLEEPETAPTDPAGHSEPNQAPARIELSPRPRPEPTAYLPYDEPPAAPAAPVQPTITIGHVTVEIVDEPRPAAAAPRPLTAASASVIGPLGQAHAARRLFALRRL